MERSLQDCCRFCLRPHARSSGEVLNLVWCHICDGRVCRECAVLVPFLGGQALPVCSCCIDGFGRAIGRCSCCERYSVASFLAECPACEMICCGDCYWPMPVLGEEDCCTRCREDFTPRTRSEHNIYEDEDIEEGGGASSCQLFGLPLVDSSEYSWSGADDSSERTA